MSVYGDIARKHVGWHGKDTPDAAMLRTAVNATEDPQRQRDAVLARFATPAPAAAREAKSGMN